MYKGKRCTELWKIYGISENDICFLYDVAHNVHMMSCVCVCDSQLARSDLQYCVVVHGVQGKYRVKFSVKYTCQIQATTANLSSFFQCYNVT